MTFEPKKLLDGLCSKVGQFKAEKPSAGTKFRLMGLVEDILEVTAMLLQEVLEVVRREAVLDADVDIDYVGMAEAVLTWELDEHEGQNEEMRELTQKANEALCELSNVLLQIDGQLKRHHKDEEYVRLYEAEKRRYMNAGTSKRARQKFDEWKEIQCYGTPTREEMEDYRMEKVLHMFEKGVFKERVEHIQRATRYPGEPDFEQLDDDNPMKKTAHRHYAALRKLVDWKDGELVVNPARVGRHFFACRHEANAKSNRTNFLKYMHKIEMLQLMLKNDASEVSVKDDILSSVEAQKYWKRLKERGFVNDKCQLQPETTRKQAMYIAELFAEKMNMKAKWKPFQDLWGISNLAQEKWDCQQTGVLPQRYKEIETFFDD
ncbi:MAG: hypothetical protein IKH86_09365 [Prevotella sp.]|nr:hypothetical protein [Prevotella sp.]